MREMKKFLFAIFAVFYAVPKITMAAPTVIPVTVQCPYPGSVDCKIIKSDGNAIIKVTKCEEFKNYMKGKNTPGAGKAILLVKYSNLTKCLGLTQFKESICDREIRYIRGDGPSQESADMLVSCAKETTYETIYESGNDYRKSEVFNSSYNEQLCTSTGGTPTADGGCKCSGKNETVQDGQCFCKYGDITVPKSGKSSCPDSYLTACMATGGTNKTHFDPTTECICPGEKHLKQSSDKGTCVCDTGYIWQDPTNKQLGCVLKEETLTINITIKDNTGKAIRGVEAVYNDKNGKNITVTANFNGILNVSNIPNTAYFKFSKDGYAPAIYSAVELKNKTFITLQSKQNSEFHACMPQSQDTSRSNASLQTDSNKYVYCGNKNEYDCNQNDIVKGYDNKLYKCTGTVWSNVDREHAEACGDHVLKYSHDTIKLDTNRVLLITQYFSRELPNGISQKSAAITSYCKIDDLSQYCADHPVRNVHPNACDTVSASNNIQLSNNRSAAAQLASGNNDTEFVTISGTVVGKSSNSETTEPLEFVNVITKSSKDSPYNDGKTITDAHGKFELKDIKSDDSIIFSYLERFTLEKTVTELIGLEKNNQNIVLEVSVTAGEVQITSCAEPTEIYDDETKRCIPDECKISGGERDDTDKCICSTERGLKPDNEENPQKCECTEDGFQYNKDAQKCVAPTQTKDLSIDTTCVDSGGTPADDGTCSCDKTKNLKPSEDNKQCVQNSPQVSEEEFRQRLSAAQDKFNQAKENEQSDANRALTSLSTAATGLGTMAAASALAERKADEKAEADMRQYLTTMQCEYGKGNIVNAGNEEITIPGGNELSKYYAEYKSLADNLKTTKTALGLRAGIESETLYDQAQTGLYQYATAERQTGAYTSLARALTDPESQDAAMWAEQKKDTKTKLIAGAAVAGVGVVGGIAGNYLINEYEWDDDDDDPNLTSSQRQQKRTCRHGGGTWDVTNGCQCSASAGLTQTADKTTCTCSADEYKYSKKSKKCIKPTNNQTINIDVTKNGSDYAGFNANNTCTRKGEIIELTGRCAHLLSTPGTWWTLFSYARSYSSIFYGESKCETSSGNKTICSCKPKTFSLDGDLVDVIENQTKWGKAHEYSTTDECKANCASKCASSFADSQDLRQTTLKNILK